MLTLQHNNDEGIIRCDMQTYSSRHRPSYTALSYTWGANTTHADIELNGFKVSVRENLWEFLRQQLLHGNYGPFWIDALCINQSDVRERSHQVQMMGSIYEEAHSVLIWLGKESDDSNLAMQALEDWDWCRRTTIQHLFATEGKITDIFLARGTTSVVTWNSQQVRGILSLCERKYWSRMWIIQEIMLASRIEIHCGPKILEWYKLEQLYYYLNTQPNVQKDMDTPFHNAIRASPAVRTSPVMAIVKIRAVGMPTAQLRRWHKEFSIEDLMETYGDHECEDVRDKVYALLGVTTCGFSIVVDYRKQVKDILLDVFYFSSSKMAFNECWDKDGLSNFGRLLEKVLRVPFLETELQFHVNHSYALTSEELPKYMEKKRKDREEFGYNMAYGSGEFFRDIQLARRNTSYAYESAHTQ